MSRFNETKGLLHEKWLPLLGLCTGAAQGAVIVTYPYVAPRAVVITPAPIVVAPAPVALPAVTAPVAHPLARWRPGRIAIMNGRMPAMRSIICNSSGSMNSITYRRSASIILIRVTRVNFHLRVYYPGSFFAFISARVNQRQITAS
ncbi:MULTISPECIES: hypothetical protein [Serratia]|uniref:hypothetical protein n=1 Tax=Serratia TaxID=613 RepID=UPI0024065412|nr:MULTISPECIES: hypothetical protein [Serratia]MDF9720255.1 hypothetical protein [Serratia marcescens]